MRPPHLSASDAALYYFFLGRDGGRVRWWRSACARTRVGRSFIAIRDSEMVASAYGIRPVRVKLTGFVVSGAIAALAGAMLTYQLGSVYSGYGSVTFSIAWLANAVVGGITSIFGPIIGALFFGLYPELSKSAVSASNISYTFEILSAVLLIVIMAINPEGLATMGRFLRSRVSAHADDDGDAADLAAIEAAATAEQHVEALVGRSRERDLDPHDRRRKRILSISGGALSFGGVAALDGVSFDVPAGQIVGVIGPNGAGKTTLFDCISGFRRPDAGSIVLRGADDSEVELTRRPPYERTRLGVGRTFQNARLFQSMPIRDILRTVQHDGMKRPGSSGRCSVWAARRSTSARSPSGPTRCSSSSASRPTPTSRPWSCRPACCACASWPRSSPCGPAAAARRAVVGHRPEGDRGAGAAAAPLAGYLGATLLLIEHDMPLIMGISDEIVAMAAGKVITIGTPDEVRNHPEVLTSYLGARHERRDPPGTGPALMLDATNLDVHYGRVQILFDVSISVGGASSSRCSAPTARASRRSSRRCRTCRRSAPVASCSTAKTSPACRPTRSRRAALAHVPGGRGNLPDLTVEENLRLGGHLRRERPAELAEGLERATTLFPWMGERRRQLAGTLSGGEQQMLAIARALVHRAVAADGRRAVARPGPDDRRRADGRAEAAQRRGHHRARRRAARHPRHGGGRAGAVHGEGAGAVLRRGEGPARPGGPAAVGLPRRRPLTARGAVFRPVAIALPGVAHDAARWRLHEITSAELEPQLLALGASYRAARLALDALPPLSASEDAADQYRRSLTLGETWVEITRVAISSPPGELADQVALTGQRVRELADRVFDRGHQYLVPLIGTTTVPGVEVVPPSAVPDWVAEGLVAGPPLDVVPPPVSAAPPVRATDGSTQPRARASWPCLRLGASGARRGSRARAIAALDGSRLQSLARALAAAGDAVRRLPDPLTEIGSAGSGASVPVALRFLIDGEAARVGQIASMVRDPGARTSLQVVARRLLVAGEGVWVSDLPARPSGLPASLL